MLDYAEWDNYEVSLAHENCLHSYFDANVFQMVGFHIFIIDRVAAFRTPVDRTVAYNLNRSLELMLPFVGIGASGDGIFYNLRIRLIHLSSSLTGVCLNLSYFVIDINRCRPPRLQHSRYTIPMVMDTDLRQHRLDVYTTAAEQLDTVDKHPSKPNKGFGIGPAKHSGRELVQTWRRIAHYSNHGANFLTCSWFD
ncbi:hypothetical protein CSKR_106245 [Clonorchis sinensis]|uniref:Uncharacterized protein n=1 Tax=Clonorchis sinensis TaxID=79923 RepID=A0A419PT32_CLOSI|nr:hypothetical protein CSKR_106245 [Clonorchis sinensis]